MDQQIKRIKFMDTWVLYLVCLISTLLINSLLTGIIGIFARMISQILIITLTLLFVKRTGQKMRSVFAMPSYTIKQAIGTALVLGGVIMLCIPSVLLFHVIAPDFAVTGYHIVDLAPSAAKYLWVVLLVLLTALAGTVLFDGYVFGGFKYIENVGARSALISLLYAMMFADVYVFVPLFIIEMGIFYVREQTEGLKLPFVMQLFASASTYAILQLGAKESSFIGTNEGASKIIGMAMIFIGVSALLLWWSSSLLGKKSALTPFGKLMTVVIFIIFLAIGSGLVSL